MKFFIATLLLAAVTPIWAGVEDDVKKAEQAWADGVMKNDFALLGKVLADDLHYLHSTGSVDTKASYIESMRSGRQRYKTVKFNNLKVRVYGDAAVVNGDANFEFVTAGKPGAGHLVYTHVFVKKNGQWQLVSHQSLRLPD